MTTYLLDTQAFIWMDGHSDRLSNTARALILNPDNELFLSLVSIWEMQIKHQLGKLQLRVPLATIAMNNGAIGFNFCQSSPIKFMA